jgi:hypothetical protein
VPKKLILGVAIEKTKLKDNSLIIKVLSNEGDLLSGITYHSKVNSHIQHLNFYQMNVVSTPGKDLMKFYEIQLAPGFIGYDLVPPISDQYFVIAELCKVLFREEDPGRDIFSFLNVELRYFSGVFNPDFHIIFLAKLIAIYGYMPEGPYKGFYFDFREGSFCENVPSHPDYCDAGLINHVFDFINGNSDILRISNSKSRHLAFTSLLRFLELQKGIKLSLKSIEIIRDLRN